VQKHKYELVFLVAPDVPEEAQQELADRMKGYAEQSGGVEVTCELWEKRTLAYEIKKFKEAFYYILRFEGEGRTVDELERRMRVADEIIRFLTIRKDEEEKVAEKRKQYYDAQRQSLDKRRRRGDGSGSRDGRDHRERRDHRDRSRGDRDGGR
jgi:small subunit ribosomal protein S6